MIGVARNVLRNARRSKNRRSTFEATLRPYGDDHSAEDHVIADVNLRDALAALTEDDREFLLLNAWDGLDTHALGVLYVISTNAAAVRLSRVQSRFRDLLGAVDVH
jgi:RNA polymerase sigma-70 factor (ECF subfamily)